MVVGLGRSSFMSNPNYVMLSFVFNSIDKSINFLIVEFQNYIKSSLMTTRNCINSNMIFCNYQYMISQQLYLFWLYLSTHFLIYLWGPLVKKGPLGYKLVNIS